MTREEVLEVVTHTGDCYRIKSRHEPEPFNFYVSKIGKTFLEQDDSGGLPYNIVSFDSIESIEAY